MPDKAEPGFKEIFLEALERPSGERAAYVERACAGDERLRHEVMELLLYAEGTDSRFDSPIQADGVLGTGVPERIAHFRIRGLLGRGGMGVVYLAEQEDPPRQVALKVVNLAAYSSEALGRFHREAAVLRRLEHPGIARFFETGVFDSTSGPLPYLTMEVVEGAPLTLAAARAGLDARQRLSLLADVCDAVAHAHGLGIVHRDLKPENILVGEDGKPRILDFGVSRVAGRDGEESSLATRTGFLLGTPQYMSPEQAEGIPGKVGPASDVYAIGMIAFELLTGRPPYDAKDVSLHRAMVRILTVVPPLLGSIDRTLRGDVETIVGRALEKAPEHRYPSAAELRDDLQRHLAGRRVRARQVGRLRRAARILRQRQRTALWIGAAAALGTAILISIRAAQLWSERSAQRTRMALAALYETIDAADRKLHLGTSSREDLLESIALLETTRADLTLIPPYPFSPEIRRYLLMRSGEALYFLGSMDHDPEAFIDAAGVITDASKIPRLPGALASMDSVYLRERLMAQTPLRAVSLGSMVHQALATYRSPLNNLDMALKLRRYVAMQFPLPDPSGVRFALAEDSTYAHRMVLNELGESLVHLGSTRLDPGLLERGLAELTSVRVAGGIGIPAAQGSLLFNLGVGYARRAEHSHDTADLDSAMHYFDASLEHRASDRRIVHTETRRAMAEAALLRATLVPAREDKARSLEEALRHLDAVFETLLPDDHAFEFARVRCQLAEVITERAALYGKPENLARADSLLDSAAALLTSTRYPLQHAQLLLRRAAVLRCRWTLQGDDEARQGALRHLEKARYIAPPAQDPRFGRLLDAEAERLRPLHSG